MMHVRAARCDDVLSDERVRVKMNDAMIDAHHHLIAVAIDRIGE
ncbi:MAG: hypothetical protein ABI432_07090 [Flavobacteriales bacterium]